MTTDLTQIDPSTLRIDLYPTEALRMKSSTLDLEQIPEQTLRSISERMIALMSSASGIGLAAPQVGLPIRMFVAHVPADPEAEPSASGLPCTTNEPQVYLNPEITEFSKDLEPCEEGCLSLPGIHGEVTRPSTVTMKAIGINGEPVELRATGMLARCWQHEIDHLDGVMIIDKMSQMSRLKNRARIKTMEKAAKR